MQRANSNSPFLRSAKKDSKREADWVTETQTGRGTERERERQEIIKQKSGLLSGLTL